MRRYMPGGLIAGRFRSATVSRRRETKLTYEGTVKRRFRFIADVSRDLRDTVRPRDKTRFRSYALFTGMGGEPYPSMCGLPCGKMTMSPCVQMKRLVVSINMGIAVTVGHQVKDDDVSGARRKMRAPGERKHQGSENSAL